MAGSTLIDYEKNRQRLREKCISFTDHKNTRMMGTWPNYIIFDPVLSAPRRTSAVMRHWSATEPWCGTTAAVTPLKIISAPKSERPIGNKWFAEKIYAFN